MNLKINRYDIDQGVPQTFKSIYHHASIPADSRVVDSWFRNDRRIGRVIQLDGFGEIPRWDHYVLEVLVETSRLMIILFVLGTANIKLGARYLVRFFTSWTIMKTYSRVAIDRVKKNWLKLTVDFFAFMAIAFGSTS